jgi:hypothetical protein
VDELHRAPVLQINARNKHIDRLAGLAN